MREALKVIAAILFGISAVATLGALTNLVTNEMAAAGTNSAVLVGVIACLLLSGAVWLLADIAISVRK
jgi:amino acid permease